MSATKRMVRIRPTPEDASWTGPVLVRGWLRIRDPWRHPLEVIALYRRWRRVRRDLNTAKGFRSFEYWQRLESLLFGMHVGWSNNDELGEFRDCPSHREISRWAMASRLVIAMKLETLAVDADGRLINLGGFYVCRTDADLPADALFPASPVAVSAD
jgi:heme-degrading monooxygenase HmoA